ncbi:MAG: hypothetical protein ILO68_08505, partial [Clostridia bacterium]|nr:hypothetical protein [Clostridia bacterium]
LYLSLRIAEWDGFQRYNSMVCDGDGFSVRFGFQDGGSVNAHGSNAYPDRYREFRQGMDALLDPIRDQMLEDARQAVIRKGCKGNVTSVLAVFKQQGTSGSDSYHLLLTKHGVRTKNFDLRVQADSGSFFPAGETVLCLSAPDDRLPFGELTELVRKHDLIRWYDYEATDPDYGNREWFQICFGLDDGTSIRAMGTKHPDGYDEFREDFLRAIAKAAETLSSPGDEEKD